VSLLCLDGGSDVCWHSGRGRRCQCANDDIESMNLSLSVVGNSKTVALQVWRQNNTASVVKVDCERGKPWSPRETCFVDGQHLRIILGHGVAEVHVLQGVPVEDIIPRHALAAFVVEMPLPLSPSFQQPTPCVAQSLTCWFFALVTYRYLRYAPEFALPLL